MHELDSDRYKYALRDIVYELVHRAKTERSCDEVNYRSAMLHVLGLIKDQAVNFELDLEYLGVADFDPERWFLRAPPYKGS